MFTPSHQLRIETQFVELMCELFQLDEAEALDFGIYRVIRHHNREVRAFLGRVVKHGKYAATLEGGRLTAILGEAFRKADNEAAAQDQARLKTLEGHLGITAGMNKAERAGKLEMLAAIPATKDVVDEYRALLEQSADSGSAEHDRIEVLNRLYQFFERHYQDGDFIVERRYGRNGARYIRSTGEDTEFHWATEDMYYVKSGDIFTDYPVRLANGQRIVFSVEPESLQATRAQLKPNDKAHYELHGIQDEDDRLQVQLRYLKGAQTDKQREEITAAIHARTGGDPVDIKRWLARFIARNQSDFFIHKRLREALAEDLDIFLKTEVLDAEQLLADRSLSPRAIKVGRIVRQVGLQIIDFLAALEDFQKALWEKKKLVLQTRYVITLDRLARHAPDWLAAHIDTIVATQRAEWQALGLGDFPDAAACQQDTPGDLASPAQGRYLPLPVDTAHFGEKFKWSMLTAVSAAVDLDDALEGVAIRSDNWQALNTLQTRYREQVKCVYIDPPYNTDAGPIDYKNGYRNASWISMMENRVELGRRMMRDDGVLCCTIDDYEQKPLGILLERIFGEASVAGVVSIRINPSGRPKPSGFAVAHEYAFFIQNSVGGQLEKLDRTEAQKRRYKEIDENGNAYMWELFRKRGSNSERSARPTLYYPLYVKGTKVRVPAMAWDGANRCWRPLESAGEHETILFPIDDNGAERTWRYKPEEVRSAPGNFRATQDREGKWTVYYKYRPASDGVLPTTMWTDSKFSATEHGTGALKKLFGKNDAFSYPKSVFAVEESIKVAGALTDDAWVMDFFGGSGTTAHAVAQLNASGNAGARFLLVEANPYFESVIVPRIKKVAYSLNWVEGQAQDRDGRGIFARIQTFEQYEDTLENLALPADDVAEDDFFDDFAFALRYRLDRTSRRAYCDIAHFTSPFGYQLKRVEGGGDAPLVPVDLVESLIYLLGLTVRRLFREPQGVVVTGSNPRGQSVAVFFRDCAAAGSAEWVAGQLAAHPTDRVYVNAVAELSFPGCDRLEAIETVFAGQFGGI